MISKEYLLRRDVMPLKEVSPPIQVRPKVIYKSYKGQLYRGTSFTEMGYKFIFNGLFDEPIPFQGELMGFLGDTRLSMHVSIRKVER